MLEDVDLFDAAFFGFSPREAELLDPQQRLFLECAWEALEDAGYDSLRTGGAVGVFGGVSSNSYHLFNLFSRSSFLNSPQGGQAFLGSDKDFLTTRVSYKLDLRGPSLAVQTACSTSLVAVHLACQSLLAGECDMALAGGVLGPGPAGGRLPLPGRGHPVAGRPLPRLRRGGGRHGPRRAASASWCSSGWRTPWPTATPSTR